MKKKLSTFLLAFSLLFVMTGCDAREDWNGLYRFDAEFGENAAQTPVIVTYEVRITAKKCELLIAGYQVADEILCEVKKEAKNKLNIRFKSYADGSLTSFYPVQLYQVDELLFSLTIENGELITEWGGLITDNPFPKKGTYFEKQDE